MVVRDGLGQDAAGKPLGYQVTFFRSAAPRRGPSAFAPKQLIIGHGPVRPGQRLLRRESAREGFGLAYARWATRTSSWTTGACGAG
jgi:predicted secreted hydrolase